MKNIFLRRCNHLIAMLFLVHLGNVNAHKSSGNFSRINEIVKSEMYEFNLAGRQSVVWAKMFCNEISNEKIEVQENQFQVLDNEVFGILTAPIAIDDSYSIFEDNTLTVINPGGLLDNDIDPDGDNLSINIIPLTPPSNGILTLFSNGTFEYQPDLNFNGTDSFVYQVCDDAATQECSSASVTITVTSLNDAPQATNDVAAPDALEDIPYNGSTVLGNDMDVDASDMLTVNNTPIIAPIHGGLTLNSDGTYTYTPLPNFFGFDSFSYQVCDNGIPQLCAVGSVDINIIGFPDPPAVGMDFYSSNEDAVLNGSSVLVNDLDFDSQLLVINITPFTSPTHGLLTIDNTGAFVYTPNSNYNGPDFFAYEVCDDGLPAECSVGSVFLTVNPINDAPSAINDFSSTTEDTPLNGTTVLINDSDLEGNPLSVNTTPITNVTNGTLVLNSNGEYLFTPNTNYSGTDFFIYTVCDNQLPALCGSATVTITVNASNDAPLGVDDVAVTNEDVVLNGATVLTNDSDPDGDLLFVNTTVVVAPLHGLLNLNSNGTFTYSPFLNYSGTDSFVYEVCDNGSTALCSTASVSITINSIPDAPSASSDNYATNEDALLNGSSVLINDLDGDNDVLTVNTTPISNVSHGVLVLNSDGTFIYIPTSNYNGTDNFTYQVCDGTTLCATATVIITISSVNDAPIAVNDAVSINEDLVLNGNSILLNDSDPEGDNMFINTTAIALPAHGTLVLNANGTYVYSPILNYNGLDSFVYQVCDNGTPVSCSTATVNITINAVNDSPIPTNDFGVTNEDTPFNGATLLINDTDIDGNPLNLVTVPISNTSNGTLVLNANGTFSYTPNPNFNGVDSFIYSVCDNGSPSLCANGNVTITINAVNDSPISVNDIASTSEDNPLIGSTVLINDSDLEGNALTVSSIPIASPAHGVVSLNSNGTYVYTPMLNYNGSDSFVYEVCDNAAPAGCSSAVVTISISPVNDNPIANLDVYTTNEDSPLNGSTVLSNDIEIEGDPMSVSISPVVIPLHGSLTLNSDGTFTYIPNTNYSGNDSFVYRVCDNGSPALCSNATVTITINPINDSPIAVSGTYSTSEDVTLNGSSVLANDSDPDGDALSVNTTPIVNVSSGSLTLNADGTFSYVPIPNFNGTVNFVYQVCDNAIPALCSTATTTIDIISVNDAPNAVSDNYSTNEDAPLNGTTVLINDFDAESNPITVNTTPTALPIHGLLVLNSNGTFTYTPVANFNGSDSFVYQICDNGSPSLCSTAAVNITVASINDSPIAIDDNATTLENITLNGLSVLSNDSDPESGTLSVNTIPITNVAHGSLVLNSNGTYTYTPNLNYNGFDFFIYSVCDNGTPAACSTATVTISIGAVNQFPTALNDVISTNEDTPNSDNVLTNDTDPDLDVLSVTQQNNFPTLHGFITIAANGAYTYTPNLNYNGTDIFTYSVCDNGSPTLCSNATINITVNAVNDAPVAVNDNVGAFEDTPFNGASLLINDSDVDGNPLTASPTTLVPPSHGTVLINPNGTFTYTPTLNYSGGDTFVYEVCDNSIPPSCSNAVVQLTIAPVNDLPIASNDSYITNEDVVLSASSVLSNDFDQDGNSLQVTGVAILLPLHGNLVLNANGTFIYSPFANYNGSDSFVYQVCDNAVPSLCATATVSISINSINDAPIANSNTAITTEDTPLSGISLLTNDTDPDGNPLTINTTPAVSPTHGSVVINSNGTYLYTPALNYNGLDNFTYQVCDDGNPVLCATALVSLSVTAINDVPVALDDIASTNEDTPLNGTTVLSNDNDPDGNPLLVSPTAVALPLHGALTINSNGTYSYIPNLNYNGSDSFVYQVCDNGSPALCTNAAVTINIAAVNDNPQPLADNYSTAEDSPLSGTSLLLNDADPEGGLLVITTVPISNPAFGAITLNVNGTFLYTPTSNYNGPDSFVYQVCDAGIPVKCATATAFISVTPVNDAPLAINDNGSTLEDVPLIGTSLVANDSDPDGNILSINIVPTTNPTNGSLVINANGTYTYTPVLGYTGFDSFEYQVCDNGNPTLCDNATVTIGIGAVNHSPSATNDAFTTNENSAINSTLSANDSDPDGNNLIYSTLPVVAPLNGNVSISVNGTFTYTPNPGYSGSESFTYQVCDNGIPSLCATATSNITINPVNDSPIANLDNVITPEDVPLIGVSLLTNDSDPDGNSLTISLTPVNAPLHGTLVLNANGDFNYTPDANYNGNDNFVYQICDNGSPSLCDTATVFIVVSPVNDAPLAAIDSVSTFENTMISGNVLANDSDVDGIALSVSVLSNVSNGTMVLNANGAFDYTPNNGFIGNDTLTYLLCDGALPALCDTAFAIITVSIIPNSSPLALPDNFSVNEDNTLNTIPSVLLNDADPNANNFILNTTPIIPPANGTVTLNLNGTFTYSPQLNFNGSDSFVYQICDDGTPSLCDTATVIITVTSINDSPVAVVDSVSTLINIAVSGDVLLNDTDVDGPNAVASPLSLPSNGFIVLNSNGSFTYTPAAGFTGVDSILYTICDGGIPDLCAFSTLFITVQPLPPNQAPVAVGETITTDEDIQISGNLSSNDSDPEASSLLYTAFNGNTANGTIAISSSGNFIYVPSSNYFGTDSYIYTVCDTSSPQLCDTAMLSIIITSVNDAPQATNDSALILQGTATNGNLLSNDYDIEGTTLTSSLLILPINGIAVVNSNGTFTYTPNSNFVGTDIFSYKVCDGGIPSSCDTALVVVTVNAPPCAGYLANSDAAVTSEDFQVIISELTNDNFVLANVVVAITSNPLHGTAVFNTNNSITYTPDPNFNGSDSLVYSIGRSSGPAICDTALIIISVLPENDSPLAVNDTLSTTIANPVAADVSTNDYDVDGPFSIYSIIAGPSNGALIFNANGSFTYTPNAGFNGSDNFSYLLCDGATPALCDTGLVNILVNGQICAGFVALADTVFTTEDASIVISALSNDTVVLANVGISIVSIPAHGTLVLNANQTFTYTPNLNFFGSDSFVYGVLDTTLPFTLVCDTATVLISVVSVNDSPVANPDHFPTNEGQVLNSSVLLNDSDIDSDSLTVTLLVQPQNGVLVLNANGAFTFTPNPQYIGGTNFIYTLCDTGTAMLCDTAIVFINVLKINKAPFAFDDTGTVNQGESFKGNVLLNDTDPDLNDLLTVSLISKSPAQGTVNMETDGTFTYVADDSYIGIDSFAYEVCDDNLFMKQCDAGMVHIRILETPITIPNAFSPDGDNINDYFVIKRIQTFPENELRVFNRWGNMVYNKKGYDNSWNGKSNIGDEGESLPSGSYFYVLYFNDGITEAQQGYIVIRK